tara:strand:+ start:1636 stop:2595 length:960 start_codon:yes stop_codon:yes gene_type:complete
MKDKILVTGAAGFIGFHLVESLIKDNFNIYGIDNINDYYDVKLKNDRINILKQYPNFNFKVVDISDFKSISNIFEDFKPNKVVNLAAQAGVRYSIDNPFAYLNSNMVGFLNIIELCRKKNISGLIYASSSSVYGGNRKIPFSTIDRVDKPLSLYAASKRSNELIAYSYSNLFNLHTTGLRFFTVYGPWGRPDMAYYKFANKISLGEPIDVYNNGNMKRDFTYIDDIISGIRSSIDKNYQCEVFNLGNNKSENLMDIVNYIQSYIGKEADINYMPMQPGDVKETFAEISKSIEMLDYKPTTNAKVGMRKFIDWYKQYNIS